MRVDVLVDNKKIIGVEFPTEKESLEALSSIAALLNDFGLKEGLAAIENIFDKVEATPGATLSNTPQGM